MEFTETTTLIEELEPVEEVGQEEYEGTQESQSDYAEIPELSVPEPPEDAKRYTFITIKDFKNRINYPELQKVKGSLKYLTNIVELMTDAVEDRLLVDASKTFYPNIQPIRSQQDREVIIKMLLQGPTELLTAYGSAYLDTWIDESRHLGLIFENQTDEIVGSYQVVHRNELAVDIVIYLRGGFKNRAKAAKEMVVYWGTRYAQMIHQEGYEYALATTLTKKHAALVESVKSKECKIIVEKLRNEKPDRSIEELKQEAKRLAPGFKNTGTIMPRTYEGAKVWETNWRYDLKAKFQNEHI